MFLDKLAAQCLAFLCNQHQEACFTLRSGKVTFFLPLLNYSAPRDLAKLAIHVRPTGDVESYLNSVFKLDCILMKRLEFTLNSVFY